MPLLNKDHVIVSRFVNVMVNKEDFIGRKFTRLEVISFYEIKKVNNKNRSFWKCLCDCGNSINVSRNSLTNENTKSCGCLYKETRKTCGKVNKKNDKYLAEKNVYRCYKKDAKKRNLIFEIDFELFLDLVNKYCIYCNSKPNNKIKYHTHSAVINGLDRVNNTLGYVKDNIVSCCSVCNKMKRTYSLEDFKKWAASLNINYSTEKEYNEYTILQNLDLAFNKYFYSIKSKSKYRKLEFNLSKDFVYHISLKNCYYCSKKPENIFYTKSNIYKFYYSGIDRVDNNLGYLEYNCVPCCKQCNYAKNNHTIDFFIQHVKNINEIINK